MSDVNAILELLKAGGESLKQANLIIGSLNDPAIKEALNGRVRKEWVPANRWSDVNKDLKISIDDHRLSHNDAIEVWITLLDCGILSEEQTTSLYIDNIGEAQLNRLLLHFPNLENLGVYAISRGWGRRRTEAKMHTSLPKNLTHCTKLKKLYFEGHTTLETIDPMLRDLKNLENLSLKSANITHLPSFLLELPKLRVLNVQKVQKLMTIPQQLIAKESLEKIYLDTQFYKIRKFDVALPNTKQALQKVQLTQKSIQCIKLAKERSRLYFFMKMRSKYN